MDSRTVGVYDVAQPMGIICLKIAIPAQALTFLLNNSGHTALDDK